MDLVPRGRGQSHEHQSVNEAFQPAHHHHKPASRLHRHIDWAARTVRIELFIILLGCSLLLAAVCVFLASTNTTSSTELDRVATNKYQAVFLNAGAGTNSLTTYFGHIKAINNNYYVMQDVYYLTTTQTKTPKPQLTKLGCDQIHSPYDQMVINRNQVAYWENIADDGQIGQAIATYRQKFPNGPDCTASSSSTQSTTTPATTPATTQSTTTP